MKKTPTTKPLVENDLVVHHRYGLVTFFDDMGKNALIRTFDNKIIGVHTRLLKPFTIRDVKKRTKRLSNS